MATEPTLTIGIPVYNGERYLETALASAVGQEGIDLEVVVADNGSTDGTASIARRFAGQDRRVRYLPSLSNKGSAWNWNRCVYEARGPYFNWLCADDALAPDHSRRCVAALSGGGDDAVLAYPDALLVDEHGAIEGPYRDPLDLTTPDVTRRVESLMTSLVLINPLLATIRTGTLKSTRLMQGFAQADIVLLLELMLRGRAVKVDERLFLRRRHPDSSMLAAESSADLDTLYDPQRPASAFPTWRLIAAYARAVGEAPLSARQRAEASLMLGKSKYRKRLWREVATTARSFR